MQSVADKEALLSKMSSLLEISTEAKRQVSEQAEMHKESASRLRMKLTASSSEITKGNQIIAKLQSDGQALRGKLKLKQAVVQQLQEQGSQKDASLHSADKAAAELRARIAELTNEKERADEGCANAKAQLAEAQELLKSNQQVIQWLNKELNDAQTSHRSYAPASSFGAAANPNFNPNLNLNFDPTPTPTPTLT